MLGVLNENVCIILKKKKYVAEMKPRLLWCPVCNSTVHTDKKEVVEIERKY